MGGVLQQRAGQCVTHKSGHREVTPALELGSPGVAEAAWLERTPESGRNVRDSENKGALEAPQPGGRVRGSPGTPGLRLADSGGRGVRQSRLEL